MLFYYFSIVNVLNCENVIYLNIGGIYLNKILKPFTCALVAIFALSTSVTSSTLGSLGVGVDSVSAATAPAPAPTPTPAPTPSPSGSGSSSSGSSSSGSSSSSSGSSSSGTATSLSGLLKLGSRGSAVTLLQTKLNSNGYKLKTDGIFGVLTVEAVRNYQALHALAVDGLAGPATFAKLTPPPVVKAALLTLGSNSFNVKALQTKLNAVGYKLVVDGMFGKLTKIAVANYQALHALAVDGIAGPLTLAKLFPAKATVVVAPVLKLGSRGTAVKALQTKLNSNGYKLVTDGIFGKLTAEAVKNYQALHGLTANGIVAATTYAKLNAKPVVKPPVETPDETPDVVTTASIVDNITAFEKAISPTGNWIAAIVKDLTTTKELVLDGDKTNRGASVREIALYAQDAKGALSDTFTLTAPKLTIKSANANITHGVFKGDVYVTVANFKLVNAKVDGNIYFSTQAIKDSFKLEGTSSVTGKQELVTPVVTPPDVVTTASIVDNATAFEKAIGLEATGGKWIVATVKDLVSTKNLVLEGKLLNGKLDATTGTPLVQRKLALYAQDAAHVVTERYTLTAPKLTVLSPEAVIQGGTFKGDVYVNSRTFKLTDATIVGDVYVHSTEFTLSKGAKIQGNVYFDNIEAQKTFSMDATSSVTGSKGFKATTAVDSVTSASLVNDTAALETSISPAGTWITAIQRDMVDSNPLVMEGDNLLKDGVPVVGRKLALYYHDGDNYTTARFTLTTPRLTVKSVKSSIQKGILRGDLSIEATGFTVKETRIEGNVYFATQALKDAFVLDAGSSITGQQIVGTPPDVVTTASIVDNAAAFETAIGTTGKWIIGTIKDIVSANELVVAGDFSNVKTPPVQQRKIVLYTRDAANVETARFSVTAPKLTINSPKASISNGTINSDVYVNTADFKLSDIIVNGDVYVSATNFTIAKGTKINGNIYFSTQGAKDTFVKDVTAPNAAGAISSVTGTADLLKVDAVATASLVDNATAFETAIGTTGKWIITTLNNITSTKALVVDGEFKKAATDLVTQRKIGLYTQAKQDGVNVTTARFSLTAPSLTIKSTNTSIQKGTFIGNIFVSAAGFSLKDAKVTGNISFTTQALLDAFTATGKDATSTVSGTVKVDVVTTPSVTE